MRQTGSEITDISRGYEIRESRRASATPSPAAPTAAIESTGARIAERPSDPGSAENRDYATSASVVSPEDLYPDNETSLTGVAHILDRCLAHTRDALGALQRSDLLEADGEMIYVRQSVPELFCHRRLGAGFEIVVAALHMAFTSSGSEPLPEASVQAIMKTLLGLRRAPLLSVDKATDLVIELEDAGLKVDPPEFAALADAND